MPLRAAPGQHSVEAGHLRSRSEHRLYRARPRPSQTPLTDIEHCWTEKRNVESDLRAARSHSTRRDRAIAWVHPFSGSGSLKSRKIHGHAIALRQKNEKLALRIGKTVTSGSNFILRRHG